MTADGYSTGLPRNQDSGKFVIGPLFFWSAEAGASKQIFLSFFFSGSEYSLNRKRIFPTSGSWKRNSWEFICPLPFIFIRVMMMMKLHYSKKLENSESENSSSEKELLLLASLKPFVIPRNLAKK